MSIQSSARIDCGDRICKLREEARITQADAARKSKLTPRQVSHIERGKSGPTRAEILTLIHTLPVLTEEDSRYLHRKLHQFRPRKSESRKTMFFWEMGFQM